MNVPEQAELERIAVSTDHRTWKKTSMGYMRCDNRTHRVLKVARAKSVTIDGCEYPSYRVASELLGIPYSKVLHYAKHGKWPRAKRSAQPVVIDGVRYESMTHAAHALGKSVGSIHWALKHGNISRG